MLQDKVNFLILYYFFHIQYYSWEYSLVRCTFFCAPHYNFKILQGLWESGDENKRSKYGMC
jgi:hypothetical protein